MPLLAAGGVLLQKTRVLPQLWRAPDGRDCQVPGYAGMRPAPADAKLMYAQALAERNRFRHHATLIGRGLLRMYEDRLDEAAELFLEARTLSKAAGDHISEFQANESLVPGGLQRAVRAHLLRRQSSPDGVPVPGARRGIRAPGTDPGRHAGRARLGFRNPGSAVKQ